MGRVILRKREINNNMFFVKKGVVEVKFRKTFNEEEPENEEITEFIKLPKGSFFNISNAFLKKFSLFEFVVASDYADLLILNAPDAVLLAKKC
jgi:hypothetical protein